MVAPQGTEVRVHGIGNHGPLSALGSPRRRDGRILGPGDNDTALVEPVLPPDHRLWFVAWTRASRSLNSFAWYLGLPFTLCNTAGHMRPSGRGERTVAAISAVFGCLLTLGAFLWSVTIIESVWYQLRIPDDIMRVPTSAASLWIITAAWVTMLARRAFRTAFDPRELRPAGQMLAAVQATIVVAAAVTIDVVEPAVARSQCVVGGPPACLIRSSDWTTLVAWTSIAIALVVALVLSVATFGRRPENWHDGATYPLLGSGLTLLFAALLLHVVASVLSLLVDLVFGYLGRQFYDPLVAFYGWIDRSDPFVPAVPQLRPYDPRDLIYRGTDTIATALAPVGILILLFLLVLGVKLLGGKLVRKLFARTDLPQRLLERKQVKKDRRARRVHTFVTHPPPWLWPTSAIVLSLGLTVTAGWSLRAMGEVQVAGLSSVGPRGLDELVRSVTVVGLHVMIVVVPLLFLNSDLRKTIAVLSDVVGYWSIQTHPLAAPPYRFDVIDQAAPEIAHLPRPLTIVGHSQGSVLATNLVDALAEDHGVPREDLRLVTCGSPLGSLYSTFFPAHFPPARREATVGRVAEWTNFWRATDPIASPLGLPQHGDVPLPDGEERAPAPRVLRMHSDYWLEREQARVVEG